MEYEYDPVGRTAESVSESVATKARTTVVYHYGSGGTPTWTSEGSEKWTRSIAGIDGDLDVVQEAGKAPVLQLHDLQGNIVGTAEDGEAATKLLSTYNSTEFGVPSTDSPPEYPWLGANGVQSELSSGASIQGGSSYVPEIGRSLQTGPIASPGEFPNGTGGAGIIYGPLPPGLINQLKEIGLQNEAAREEAKRREAEEKASLEACPASECHVDGAGEGNVEGGGGYGGEEAVELEPGPGGGNASAAKLQHYGRLGPCSVASEGIGVQENDLELWIFTTKIKCNSRTEGTFVIESESGSALPEAFVAQGIHPVEFTTLLTTAAGAEVFFELLVNKHHYRKRYNHNTA